jgi:hypothetical protein
MITNDHTAICSRYAHLGDAVCFRLTAIARTMLVMQGRLARLDKRAGAMAELARCRAMWFELTGERV